MDTRNGVLPLQVDQPLFVKTQFDGRGRTWTVGQQFKWREMNVDYTTVLWLYAGDFLHHNPALEEEIAVKANPVIGDGLAALDIDSLHALVDRLNVSVRQKTKTEKEFVAKKCIKSTIKDKQIAHIRTWRSAYGNLED